MVALQILVLSVWVRILVGQQHEENPYSWKTVRVCFLMKFVDYQCCYFSFLFCLNDL